MENVKIDYRAKKYLELGNFSLYYQTKELKATHKLNWYYGFVLKLKSNKITLQCKLSGNQKRCYKVVIYEHEYAGMKFYPVLFPSVNEMSFWAIIYDEESEEGHVL